MTPEQKAIRVIESWEKTVNNMEFLKEKDLIDLVLLAQHEAVEKTKTLFLNILKETEKNWHDFLAEEADDAQALAEYLIDEVQSITPEKVLKD